METLTARLARFVVETRAVPEPVLRAMSDALIDTLAVGLAGVHEPCAAIARRSLGRGDAENAVAVWGTADRASPEDAAFANSVASHVLDFDDTLASMRGHSSVTTIPVALALGESLRASGREVLTALALGLEVAGKLGKAFGHGHYLRGWQSTATIGALASTAVAARLLGHDAQTLGVAWGLAAAQSGGLVRNFGTMGKPFQVGQMTRAGMLSARLAGAGMTADAGIFDGRNNFVETYAGDGTPLSECIADLGVRWEAIDPGLNVKRWPCCYCCHRAIGGLIEILRTHEIAAQDVESVTVGFPPGSDEPLIYREPRTGLEGKFSIEYPLAALLLDGRLTLASFTDEMVQRPAAQAFMKKIRRVRVEDTRVYSGTIGYTDLEVETRHGHWRKRVDRGPGSRQWPLSAEERREKFLDCASRTLRAKDAVELLETAERCADLPDVRALMRLAVASPAPRSASTADQVEGMTR